MGGTGERVSREGMWSSSVRLDDMADDVTRDRHAEYLTASGGIGNNNCTLLSEWAKGHRESTRCTLWTQGGGSFLFMETG